MSPLRTPAQFVPSVTELVVAQCYYLDFDDRNRQRPIYVYLNSTGCMNDKGQAISADNEFYAIWAALGFTKAPLYTGVTWKAQNQAAVLLSAGQKGHRCAGLMQWRAGQCVYGSISPCPTYTPACMHFSCQRIEQSSGTKNACISTHAWIAHA